MARRNPNTREQAEGLAHGFGDGIVSDAIVLDEREGPTLHRDIGQITPTEVLDGVEVINRTKTGLSPFVEIRKERLVDQLTGAPSRSFGIWVPDPQAEGGWKDMGTVSESYLLLTNREVRSLALEIARESGMAHRESRVFWDGARFAHIIDFQDVAEEVTDGDGIGLSLITRTSYDRSWKYEAALMGKRFVCDNGALSGEFFARVSFRHVQGGGDDDAWKEIVRQGLSVIQHAPENLSYFVQGLRKLRQARMTDEHLRQVWSRMKLGDSLLGKIMSRYVQHEEPTLYGLFNAGTNVFWHDCIFRRISSTSTDRSRPLFRGISSTVPTDAVHRSEALHPPL